jgi:hypothetical protein
MSDWINQGPRFRVVFWDGGPEHRALMSKIEHTGLTKIIMAGRRAWGSGEDLNEAVCQLLDKPHHSVPSTFVCTCIFIK